VNNIVVLREEIKNYFNDNGEVFEENLLSQAVNVSVKSLKS
jgi:rsbT co-antagonist protein RsbR